jgi:fibronectin-binding autotransporter adhesin
LKTRRCRRTSLLLATASTALCLFTPAVRAATKANNSDALNLTSSWVDGILPDASTTALWDSTLTGPITTTLGANLTWLGLVITDPAGDITINSGSTLTLGSAGIDMSAATANIRIAPNVLLAADQTWNVQAGRLLNLSNNLGTNVLDNGGFTLTVNTAGNTYLYAYTGSGGLNVSGTGTLSLFANSTTTYSGATVISGSLRTPYNYGLSKNSDIYFDGGTLLIGGIGQVAKSLSGSNGTISGLNFTELTIVNTGAPTASGVKITGDIRLTVNGTGQRLTALDSDYLDGTSVLFSGTLLAVRALNNGGQPSSIGKSSNDPANLYMAGTLEYDGEQPAFTDRLFTTAFQPVITWTVAPVNFTNAGSLMFADPATHSADITLGGPNSRPALLSTFSPLISGASTTLTVSGMWKVANAANTYTGATTVSGILVVDSLLNGGVNSPIGSTSFAATNLVFSSGTLRYVGAGNTTNRLFSGTTAAIDSSGTGSALIFNNTGALSLSGSLILRGTNTTENRFDPVFQGASLAKFDLGTWALTNNNTYTGDTLLGGGKLILDFSFSGRPSIINSASRLLVGAGELVVRGRPTFTSTQAFSGLVVGDAIGSPRISAQQNGAPFLNVSFGPISHTNGGTVDFVLPTSGNFSTTSSNTAGSILGGWATVGGNTWAAVTAGNIAPFNSYTANAWTGASNTDVTTSSTPAASSTTNSLRFSSTSSTPLTVTLTGLNTITSGGILLRPPTPIFGTNRISLSGGSIQAAPAADINIIQNNTIADFTLASSIVDNGGTALTKSGDGKLILAAQNSYTGNTYLQGGTTQLNAPNALSHADLSINATLDLHGFDTTVANLIADGLAQHGVITNTAPTTSTLTVNPTFKLGTFSGDINGPISLKKDGPETWVIQTRQHYTGDTIIAGGALLLRTGGTPGFDLGSDNIPTASHVIFDGGQLALAASYRQSLDHATARSGDSSIYTNPTVTFPLAAKIHVTNLSRNTGATMILNTNATPDGLAGVYIDQLNSAPIANGPSGIIGGWALVGNATPTEFAVLRSDFNNVIAGGATYTNTFALPTQNTDVVASINAAPDATTGSLRFSSAFSTLTLNGANVIGSGGILVTVSRCQIAGPAGSSITSGNGSDLIVYNPSATGFTIAAPITDNGPISIGLTKSGAGTLSLAAANTYSGPTRVNAGQLVFAADNPNIHAITGYGSVNVVSPATLTSDAIQVNSLFVVNGGAVIIRPNGNSTSLLHSLTLAGSAGIGKLDLTNNKLILQTTPATKANVLTTTQSSVAYGITHPAGITSSNLPANTALAVIDNAALPQPLTTFGGLPVDTNSILVGPELLGDANLDGLTNFADFVQLSNNYGKSNTSWLTGDFNNDNTTNFADFVLLSNHYGQSFAGNAFTATPEELAALSAFADSHAVPEPASLTLLALAAPLLLRRRNKA